MNADCSKYGYASTYKIKKGVLAKRPIMVGNIPTDINELKVEVRIFKELKESPFSQDAEMKKSESIA